MTQRRDDRGVATVEYAVLTALIAGVALVALLALGGLVIGLFEIPATPGW
jgi:Flp pilus assembly pilin Flp